MKYIIKPIHLGNFNNFEKSSFTFRTDTGTKITPPLFCYVVQGNGKNILVDSGPPSPELAKKKKHIPVHDAISLTNGLKNIGLTPDDIDCIVLTHLHWDHSYNLEIFPKQDIYVQKRELEYSMCPLPCDTGANTKPENQPVQWFQAFPQMKVVHGEHDLMEGLRLIPIPGHTPGTQGLLLSTNEGAGLITSDHYSLYENYEKGIPAGIHCNLFEWYDSHRLVQKIAAFIMPGHDERVLARNIYGDGN